MNKELKEQAHKEFEDIFVREDGLLNIDKYSHDELLSFIDSLIDKTVQQERERIVADIKKIDFMDLFMKYKRNPIYIITDEIMWQIKKDIISLITNNSDINN